MLGSCGPRSDGYCWCCASRSPGAAEPSAALAVVPGRPPFEEDLRANLFIGADPATCHGAVGFGHYPHDFDAARFVDSVRKTVSTCRHTVTAWADDEHRMTVTPGPLNASSPDVAPWTTTLSGQQWICDFAMIAKANVVSQCSVPRRESDSFSTLSVH